MFDYIFFGQLNEKRQLIHKKDVVVPENAVDYFVSLFEFDEEALNYFQTESSLVGFRGRMRIDYLPFDIDSTTLEESIEKVRKIIKDLKHHEINIFKLSFSGKKGFHLLVPAEYFDGFEPSDNLPQQLLVLAEQLTSGDFDKKIYTHLRIFRMLNTIHSKTGLYKVQIDEDFLDDPASILEYATGKRKPFKIPEPVINTQLKELKEKAFAVVPKQVIFTETTIKEKICISKMLEGVPVGERNAVLCVLTSHFKNLGLTKEMVYELLIDWNKKNQDSTVDEAFMSTFNRIWKSSYTYGCWHLELDSRCSKDCYLRPKKRKIKQAEQIQFVTLGKEGLIAYKDFIEAGEFYKMGISKRIDAVIRKLLPGNLVGIIGRPGCYKTTLAQMMGHYHVQNYPTSYACLVSLEMSLIQLVERQVQEVYNWPLWKIEEQYNSITFPEEFDRFLFTTQKNLSLLEVEGAIKNIEKNNGIKIGLLMFDFLHAIKSTGSGMTEKIASTMVGLKSLVDRLNTVGGILVHSSRGKSGDQYTSHTMGSGRDTAAIEDNCDFLLGVHKQRDDEQILRVQLLKNKNGPTLDVGIKMKRSSVSTYLEEMEDDYLPIENEEN